MFRSLGQPSIKITPDRRACARYGLNTGDVDAVIQAAIGGQAVTQVYEGEKMFDLTVRWLPEYRNSLEAICRDHRRDARWYQHPPRPNRHHRRGRGPGQRLSGRRAALRAGEVLGARPGFAGTITEAQAKIGKQVKLPYNTHLEWEGEMQELRATLARLGVIVPLTLLLISFLVYTAVKSWVDTLIVIVDIPVACTGGILALLITNTHFSVSAAMGFVSVFGIAVQDALLMVSYYQQLRIEGNLSSMLRARHSEKRFRPVLMTTLVATLGLMPAALSHGIGASRRSRSLSWSSADPSCSPFSPDSSAAAPRGGPPLVRPTSSTQEEGYG